MTLIRAAIITLISALGCIATVLLPPKESESVGPREEFSVEREGTPTQETLPTGACV